MTKQLNVRSDVAYEIAHSLARSRRTSIADVVETALREFKDRRSQAWDVLAPEEVERRYRELRALSARSAATKLPGATSDHSDMYDENGLPI
ncbi:type II toxin-antitoxin system VapB family antitoxin [Methylobacterium sp. Leaf93]|uniref:type II toxin-antitoxin system VapB family antitoxin n=1 Tax=Methylobacterium sp. Leaf93 TaxID=1736249 RepID=UPI0006FF89C4|nr:type II toxin-antitoxin system VapB family antitoxin [Methylobacterium sp. Leaf93]KQP16596.1 hypothetical protein ASF26_01830 [Methylobacterium sp. Leaf93]